MMKNKILAIVLTLCFALCLAACSSGGGGEASQVQTPAESTGSSPVESTETAPETSAATEDTSGEKDNEELSDAQKALEEAKAALAETEARNAAKSGESDSSAPAVEVNEYGITDAELQALSKKLKDMLPDYKAVWEDDGYWFDLSFFYQAVLINCGDGEDLVEQMGKQRDALADENENADKYLRAVVEWQEEENVAPDRYQAFWEAWYGKMESSDKAAMEPFMKALWGE